MLDIGRRTSRPVVARPVRGVSGERARVQFDGGWALSREESRGDVIGFLRTHPDGPAAPSSRDVRTMRAWTRSFGKPLLCLIADPGGLRGYRFDDESAGVALETVEFFRRGVVIGVDADGR
jgi:proteasome lid subunit RPN8/RPN11